MHIGQGSAIGIDFGTTNSVVAIASPNGHVETLVWPTASGPTETFRTALMFWREGRQTLHVAGPKAIERAIAPETDQRFIQSIKTHLASPLFTETRLYGERFTIERLIATFLSHLLDGLPADELKALPVTGGRPVIFAGERPDEALAVARLNSAFSEAGLPQTALAYETVLVADFGGGTSDFSVLRFHRNGLGLSTEALAHTGVGIAGDTFDYRIIDHVVAPRLGKGSFYRSFEKRLPMPAYFYAAFAQWHQLSWLKSGTTLAELKKLAAVSESSHMIEDLSSLIELDLGFELYRAVGGLKAELSSAEQAMFTFDRDGIQIEANVRRGDFEAWIAPDLAKINDAMERAIAKANVRPKDIDAVFMTGGTSFVPAVRALFLRHFGKDRIHVGDAFQSVASGLALLALDRSR
jgi:hypothetical chaperone protein